jgi:hypothetical protein
LVGVYIHVLSDFSKELIPMKNFRLLWLALVLTLTFHMLQAPRVVMAQDDEQQQQDPPARVARLNYSSGSVSFQPGGEGDWVTAVPNRPLTTGDNLWADQNSRAELHVGSLAMRMNSETSLTFLDLDDHTTQLRLSLGSLILRVRHLDDGDLLEVDTPNLAFTVQRTGEYRIDVNQDGNQTTTTVWHGRGEATGGGYSYTVVAGQQATFSGTDQLDHEIGQIAPSDDFDNFAFERDSREDHDESSNYISSEMTGYEDLDDYGHWHYVADYGPVWTPSNIGTGWAPYRYGHWVWVAPWGWTWVEDEPWGFAPFHYGRWAFVDDGWCWVPGPVYVRPVYAPALVAFVGGGGFRLSVGVGEGVAWFPLGPREIYVPPYRVSRVYVNNVNITNTRVNVTQVTNVYNNVTVNNNVNRIVYVNQRIPTAVTAVSRDTFVNARPVSRNLAQVNARELTGAPVSHVVPVQPVRSSVLGSGAPARVRPPAAIENRRVIATRNPSPPRAPFEQQRQAPNVRTETPHANAGPEPTRPPQPGNAGRPNEPARPQEPAAAPRPNEPARSPQPNEPARPQPPVNVPRPNEPPRPSEPQRPEQLNTQHPSEGYQNRGAAQPSHPLVRPAPPVQPRPQIDQNEANKFHTWQQQRPSQPPRESAPRPPQNRPPQNHPQPSRPDEHKK